MFKEVCRGKEDGSYVEVIFQSGSTAVAWKINPEVESQRLVPASFLEIKGKVLG